jgi:nitrate/TMAO reductase-like tetraheme cytochrome c subunit
MGTFVDDMRDPNSETLAARYCRHRWIPEAQCYTCHTSYGLFGDVQAKMKGLNDVYRYYTHTYKVPIRMHVPYGNADCLKCHERTPKFVDSAYHAELLAELRSGEFSCVDCHGPAHPEQVTDESSLGR